MSRVWIEIGRHTISNALFLSLMKWYRVKIIHNDYKSNKHHKIYDCNITIQYYNTKKWEHSARDLNPFLEIICPFHLYALPRSHVDSHTQESVVLEELYRKK